jgi:alpha-tubulin suppressor-like RCC1 family protein
MPIGDTLGGFIRPGYNPLLVTDAPTIGTATTSGDIGDNAISIAFTAPSDVGGGAITGYTATARDTVSTATFAATGSSSPITVTGLSAGQSYTVTVSATNAYGPSGGSAASNSQEAKKFSGQLWAWGKNHYGMLGDGTTVNKSSPVQVGALTTWVQMAGGGYHTVALKTDGTMWCWGRNHKGQLGQGDTTDRSSPVQVGALTTWASIGTDEGYGGFCLAVKTDGTLWAWGWDNYGQLGQSNTTDYSSPVQVGALTDWLSVAGGHYTATAVKTDGTLWAWGQNDKGQLAQGNTTNRSSPVQVGALTDWSTVVQGSAHVAASKTDGTLWTWGYNYFGQLGDGTSGHVNNKSSPVQVGSLTTWNPPGAGGYNTMASSTAGTLWGTGKNDDGQLGQENTTDYSSPVQVGALTTWGSTTVWCVNSFMNLKTDGTLWGCGRNDNGQLGDGTTTVRSSPVQVGALTTWVNGARGATFKFAIKN